MKIIRSVKAMQNLADSIRSRGGRIAFVPTMGYFHEGHLNLMRIARTRGDCLVVSIYVNPTQFSPAEDLETYPRDLARDQMLAESVGVDVIFSPNDQEMYPDGYQTFVEVAGVTNNLCGISRPRFFRGVTTVCTKLFQIVKPHVAVFGKKDYQQYVTIQRLVRDLNMDIQVIGMDTTRESDGLAMSSRNTYLNSKERRSALSLSRALLLAEELYNGGERNAERILEKVRKFIADYPYTEIDYARICDTSTIKDVTLVEGECMLALAVRVGKTRLIDNHVFGETLEISEDRSSGEHEEPIELSDHAETPSRYGSVCQPL